MRKEIEFETRVRIQSGVICPLLGLSPSEGGQ